MIVTKFFLATIIIMSLLVFARHLSLTLLTLKWSLSESVNDLYLSDTFRATFLDRKEDKQTDRVRNDAFGCLFNTCEYITNFARKIGCSNHHLTQTEVHYSAGS